MDPVDPDDRLVIPEIPESWKVAHMQRSRYLVMYSKCDEVDCCKPFRSPIKKHLPSGFLPAARVFTRSPQGDLILCKPENVDKSVKFASLSNILAQPIELRLPIDTYNRKVTLSLCKCPFCDLALCSPAEVRRHRRALHFRQRAQNVEENDNSISVLDKIIEIIDENDEEYLCVMEDSEEIE